MDIREWRNLAVRSVGLLAVVLLIGVLGAVRRQGAVAEAGPGGQTQGEASAEHDVQTENRANRETVDVQLVERQETEQLGDRYIEIAKAVTGQAVDVRLENDYMNFSLILTLEGVKKEQYGVKDVKRWYRKKCYTGSYQGGHDTVKKTELGAGKHTVRFVLQMRDIYEPSLLETADAWYIVLDKPEDIYDHIVVIDAGHGGDDEGTGSVGWKYREKEYALRVTECLKQILDETDMKAYYTRLEDVNVTKQDRVRLANAVHADVFVSIHCNASGQTETTAKGVETLYSTRKATSGDTLTSKALARNILDQVCAGTDRQGRKIIKRNDLYLMSHSKVPVAIVEVGYMTNASDMKYLLRKKNQMELARGIYQGIVKSLKI